MSPPTDPKLTTAFSVAFFVAVLSLALLAIASWLSLAQFNRDTLWVKNTYEAIETLNALMAQAEKATSVNRAYLITADPTLLTKRDVAVEKLNEITRELSRIMAENPESSVQVRELDEMLDVKTGEMQVLAEIRRTKGIDGVLATLKTRSHLGLMDDIREKGLKIEQMERRVLAARLSQSQESAERTQRFIIITTILAVALLFTAYVIIRRDLRERQRASRELQEAKLFAEGIVDTVRAPILVVDRNLTVLAANRSFYLTFQSLPEEVVGLALHRLHDGTLDLPELRRRVEETFGPVGEFDHFELALHIPGSGRRIYLLNGRRIQHPGYETNTVLLVFEDVTEQRQHEHEIRLLNGDLRARAEALERSNEELDTFNYSVSHDLRAPLRAISSFAHIIAQRYRADLSETARHYFDNIVAASQRMGRLIDDLLAYSRLGTASVQSRPVSLERVFSAMEREFEARFAAAQGRLEITRPLPEITGDETFVQQIFANLIDNALNYQRPGVPLHVRVTSILRDGFALIEVEDNGIGIAPEHQEKIFQIFQRLHNEEAFPGTGLGLAIVKKTVILMGGEVTVRSIVNVGTAFTVKLPLALASTHTHTLRAA